MSSFIRNNELGFNRIIHFYNLWYKQKKVVRDFFLVKYEDLIENSDSLFLLSKFLKLKINYKVVEQIYDEHKFEKMREKELKGQLKDSMSFGNDENFLKVRKAIVGSYKNEMNMDDIHFCNEIRSEITSKYPELKMTQMSQKLGQLWKELPESRRNSYNAMYAADKDRYETEMEEYNASKYDF